VLKSKPNELTMKSVEAVTEMVIHILLMHNLLDMSLRLPDPHKFQASYGTPELNENMHIHRIRAAPVSCMRFEVLCSLLWCDALSFGR
jgi:hypothetical protein